MGLTIVGIPAKDERVWELSSEEVPHLTILFLDDVEDLDRVSKFVRHAADTMLTRFYLDVRERGLLGDKDADVLFFHTEHAKTLMEFRRSLLADTDILKAYHAVDQFPQWTPHLTMGYPETPAKKDTRDYPGIHAVRFDRIALWTGDYEGEEIPLKADDGPVLAMSDAASRGAAFLEHYGVKGMKWGVIRSKLPGLAAEGIKKAYAPSEDAKKTQQYMARAKLGGVRNLNNREMQLVIQRMALEKQYKELYGERQWHNAGKKWAGNFVTNVMRDAAASWLSNPFASGRRGEDGPFRTSAYANGQEFSRVIDGSTVRRRAIGS